MCHQVSTSPVITVKHIFGSIRIKTYSDTSEASVHCRERGREGSDHLCLKARIITAHWPQFCVLGQSNFSPSIRSYTLYLMFENIFPKTIKSPSSNLLSLHVGNIIQKFDLLFGVYRLYVDSFPGIYYLECGNQLHS